MEREADTLPSLDVADYPTKLNIDGDRQRLDLAARGRHRKPCTEQAGLADLPLFGTKALL